MAGVGDIIEVWISDEEDLWWAAIHQKYRVYRFQRCLLRAFFNPNHWLHDRATRSAIWATGPASICFARAKCKIQTSI